MLSGLRVLDLADERGSFCGRLFAELGADVIKVEPPAGCSTRRVSPFLDGIPGADRSLYFIAYQAGKRSVTLNLDVADGQHLLGDLVRGADFVVESLGPDYLDSRGIGYDRMSALNPRLIFTTITPFGDRGPSAHWRALDINCWAAGGMMFLTGLPGRPPLQMAVPQAYLHAGAEAATASMLAYFSRLHDGQRPESGGGHPGLCGLDPDERAGLSGAPRGVPAADRAADGIGRDRPPDRLSVRGRLCDLHPDRRQPLRQLLPAAGRLDGRGGGRAGLAQGHRLRRVDPGQIHGRPSTRAS